MTREEAIAYGKRVIDLGLNDETQKFCEMAIKALEQEPSGDLISRQTVLKIIDGWYDNNRNTENIEDLIVLITYMDSVNPQEPKTGHWIEHNAKCYECSECHNTLYARYKTNYCHDCGARMESEEV